MGIGVLYSGCGRRIHSNCGAVIPMSDVVHHSQEWGVSQELMVETLTREGLHTWLERGISNVAYLSIALGLENVASNAFIEAKVGVALTIHCYSIMCCKLSTERAAISFSVTTSLQRSLR